MANITDTTCDWGLAQTAQGCAQTLASYFPAAYHQTQIIYYVIGAGTLLASSFMLSRAVTRGGTDLQRWVFIFCCYSSATLVLRGIDPRSYGHVVPRPIGSLLSDSCTAALYSSYILALGHWANIIQEGAAGSDKPAHLKTLENIAMTVVWVFYFVYDMCLFTTKGFNPQGIAYMTLTVSACILSLIGMTFLVYGLRVLARMQAHDRRRKRIMGSILGDHALLFFDEDGEPVTAESRGKGCHFPSGHAGKIVKILLVAESVSIVVIAGQMYMAVKLTTNTPVELSCANGLLCETVKSGVNILHVFQVACIWALLLVFGKLQSNEILPSINEV